MFHLRGSAVLFLTIICIDPMNFSKVDLYQNIIDIVDKSSNSDIVDAVMTILKNCFLHEQNTVVFAGEFLNFSNWRSKFPAILQMYAIRLSESVHFERHRRLQHIIQLTERVVQQLHYPIELYIVSLPFPFELKSILTRSRQTVLWRKTALFLLIDEHLESNCSNAESALTQAWDFNLVSAIYVCYDDAGRVHYYNFNPFADISPEPWKVWAVTSNFSENTRYPMTIYKWSANEARINKSTCGVFNFDKLLNLGGYPIYLTTELKDKLFSYANSTPLEIRADESSLKDLTNFTGANFWTLKMLWGKLNATVLVSVANSTSYIDENDQLHGSMGFLQQRRNNMTAIEHYLRSFWRLETYPHNERSLCAITRKLAKEPKAYMSRFFDADNYMALALVLTFCFNTLTLARVLEVDCNRAWMEMLRLLLSWSTTRKPHGLFRNIVLMGIVWMSIGLNLDFNSELTSTFANPKKDNNIRTSEQLVRSGYRLMGEAHIGELLERIGLRDRFELSGMPECMKLLLAEQGKELACVCDCYESYEYAIKNKYIYITEPIYNVYVVFVSSEDWPLLPRVTMLLQWIGQSGLFIYADRMAFQTMLGRFSRKVTQGLRKKGNVTYKPLKLRAILYSFQILVAGIAVSVGVFVAEGLVWKIKRRNRERTRLLKMKAGSKANFVLFDYVE